MTCVCAGFSHTRVNKVTFLGWCKVCTPVVADCFQNKSVVLQEDVFVYTYVHGFTTIPHNRPVCWKLFFFLFVLGTGVAASWREPRTTFNFVVGIFDVLRQGVRLPIASRLYSSIQATLPFGEDVDRSPYRNRRSI